MFNLVSMMKNSTQLRNQIDNINFNILKQQKIDYNSSNIQFSPDSSIQKALHKKKESNVIKAIRESANEFIQNNGQTSVSQSES